MKSMTFVLYFFIATIAIVAMLRVSRKILELRKKNDNNT